LLKKLLIFFPKIGDLKERFMDIFIEFREKRSFLGLLKKIEKKTLSQNSVKLVILKKDFVLK